jgi:hypothetical protein
LLQEENRIMHRALALSILLGLLIVPVAAQQAPEGLRVRVDESTSAEDPDDTKELRTVAMGKGFRVTGGPAGTFWNPSQTATGDYTLRGSFTLMKPSGHNNYYGLIFGGSNLDTPKQAYTYFLVAQNGTFQIRRREGGQVSNIIGRTPHQAVRQPGANGQSINALEVRVAPDTVSYVVNGTVVHSTPRAGVTTDGIVGARVNHLLDVHVEGLQVQRQ